MSTKFGLLIDFDLLKAATSTNAKPEIVLSGRAAILIKRYDVQIEAILFPVLHLNTNNTLAKSAMV